MRELLSTVVGSIKAAILDDQTNSICLIFQEMIQKELIEFAIRNLWINIIPKDGKGNKISKSMLQLETAFKVDGLHIYFSTKLPLEGKRVGGKIKVIESDITIGDQLLLLSGRHCLRQLMITEDFEKKLKEAN